MSSNLPKVPRRLFRLSIALFLVSLALPVMDAMWGWQVFAFVFSMLPQMLETNAELVLLSLTGASVNLLLFFSWVAMQVSRLRKFAPWSAAGALILGVLCLLQLPMIGLGIGYWVWLAASAVAFRAAYRMSRMKTSPPGVAMEASAAGELNAG